MVHVARAVAGLSLLQDVEGAGRPQRQGLARLRSTARFLPVHRAFHSVELSLLAGAAGVADAVSGDLTGTRALVTVLVVVAPLVLVGHLAAILSSSKLRAA
jgi:hypothetical protein